MYCICAHNGDMTEEDLNRELEKGYADMVAETRGMCWRRLTISVKAEIGTLTRS